MEPYKAPGVYVEEKSSLGSSIVAVPTAIPGFVGYTDETGSNMESVPNMEPVLITSMLDYQQTFGDAFGETFKVNMSGEPMTVTSELSKYSLYYQMQLFFANGGGICYVVSAGTYAKESTLKESTLKESTKKNIKAGELDKGLETLKRVGAVTLLVIPEAISSYKVETANTADGYKTLYPKMLKQCVELKNRFAIFDVPFDTNIGESAKKFRKLELTAEQSKYGAAYFPPLQPSLNYALNEKESSVELSLYYVEDGEDITNLSSPRVNIYLHKTNKTNKTNNTDEDDVCVQFIPSNGQGAGEGTKLKEGITYGGKKLNKIRLELKKLLGSREIKPTPTPPPPNKNKPVTKQAELACASDNPSSDRVTLVDAPGSEIQVTLGTINSLIAVGLDPQLLTKPDDNKINVPTLTLTWLQTHNTFIYTQAIEAVQTNYPVKLSPSATMAGVYAQVDASSGVWQAPANVALRQVIRPTITITEEQQQGLNFDADNGKSIDAIRSFPGLGTLVWGARTLDGNSNDWRYISVKRLFIMLESSIAQSMRAFVFSANTATNWTKITTQITSFLTGLWAQGAMAGATAQEAFYVRIGLGVTMTEEDIQNGNMIVEIGIAPSRPAEFIVLRFSQKLQQQ